MTKVTSLSYHRCILSAHSVSSPTVIKIKIKVVYLRQIFIFDVVQLQTYAVSFCFLFGDMFTFLVEQCEQARFLMYLYLHIVHLHTFSVLQGRLIQFDLCIWTLRKSTFMLFCREKMFRSCARQMRAPASRKLFFPAPHPSICSKLINLGTFYVNL